MDLLAAIAADPTLLPLWAVMLFAAGMYPVGMMFGCSPCCNPCSECVIGSLPETITVEISGFEDELVPVGIARVAPTITASAGPGSGAILGVTLTKVDVQFGGCDAPYWTVSKITVVDGGEGYSGESGISFQAAEGDTEVIAAFAEITLEQQPPEATLAINSPSGSGAELSPPVFASGYYSPGTYYIDSVAVEDGGDGYTHLDEIELTLTKGEQYSSAVLSLITANTEPTVSVSGGSGSGAVLTATLTQGSVPYNGSPVWYVSSIAIQSAGSGYAFLDALSVTVDDGDPRSGGCSVYVWSVDGNGGITSVYIFDPGQYFKGGPVTGVSVGHGGDYRGQSTGKIASVTVTDGGIYFREDASLPPCKYRAAECCADYWNGRSFVLKRTGGCSYIHVVCGTGCGQAVTAEYRGPSLPPIVGIGGQVLWYEPGGPVLGPGECGRVLEGTSLIEDCSNFSFTATNEAGVTATVTAGGEYDAEDQSDNDTGRCFTCCYGAEDPPEEIEVEVSDGYFIGPQPNINMPDNRPIGFFAPQYAGTFGMSTPEYTSPWLGDPDLPLPIVVLRRGKPSGALVSYSDRCNATWAGQMPLPGLTHYDIWVGIFRCWDESISGCDQCWKCETRSNVRVPYGQGSAVLHGSGSCQNCQDTPMCGPAQGIYHVTKNVFDEYPLGIPGGIKVRVL
jgi:hypothetical protein